MPDKPILTTKAELARQAGIDARNPVLKELDPVAEVKLRGSNPMPVYNREQAIKELSALLIEAAAKHSKAVESQEN